MCILTPIHANVYVGNLHTITRISWFEWLEVGLRYKIEDNMFALPLPSNANNVLKNVIKSFFFSKACTDLF